VLKIYATDKAKHRLCDICKKDSLTQKRIREEVELQI
jgi:hypothetical protein